MAHGLLRRPADQPTEIRSPGPTPSKPLAPVTNTLLDMKTSPNHVVFQQRFRLPPVLGGDRYLSASGLQDCAVDVAGSIGSQKGYCVGDLVGLRGPAKRGEGAKTLGEPGRDGGSRGFGGSGLYCVHPHSRAADLVGPDPGQQFHARLAGAVDPAHLCRNGGRDGTEVDDDAVAPLGHTRHQLLYQDVGGAQVDVDMLIKEPVVGVGGRAELVDAGVVDQDVDRSRAGGQAAHVVGVSKIGGDESCLPPTVLDLLNHLSAAFGATPVNYDLSAELTELQCYRPTNSGCGPSYQRGRALKCCCHRITPSQRCFVNGVRNSAPSPLFTPRPPRGYAPCLSALVAGVTASCSPAVCAAL